MAEPHSHLDNIFPGSTSWKILVKVDHSFPRTDYDLYEVDFGYPKVVLSIDLIVFDEKGSRMLMRLGTDEVIDLFGNVLSPGGVFYVRNFIMAEGGQNVHEKHHIVVLPDTNVKEFIIDAPEHGFKILEVFDIRRGWVPPLCVTDVCGIVSSPVTFAWKRVQGLINRVLTFELHDRHMNRFSVCLIGDSADRAWMQYACFKKIVNLVLIVQFGLVRKEGDEFTIENFNYATRVFWNPTFNDIVPIKKELLARAGRV